MISQTRRVLLVDHEPQVRSILDRGVDQAVGMKVVATASNGSRALELASENPPDIVLTGIEMPGINGIELCRRLIAMYPHVKVVAVAGTESTDVIEMVKTGAIGCVMRTTPVAEMARALEVVARGHAVLAPEAASLVLNHLLAYYRDERERAEASAGFESLKDDFMNVISHELNTPVAIIKAGIYTLRRAYADRTGEPDPRAQFLDVVQRQCDRLERMIAQALTISKVADATEQEDLSTVELKHVIDQAVAWFPPEKRHRIKAEIAPHRVVGEHLSLVQALIWMLENALMFSDDEVVVSCSVPDPSSVTLQVADAGIGMDERLIKQVLSNPFTQKDSSSTRQHGGLGLSLFASKKILEAAGGSLSIASEVGKGTKVSLHLQNRPAEIRLSEGEDVVSLEDDFEQDSVSSSAV